MKFGFKTALVTGGAGFIGSHLVDALTAAGCRIRVLDNLASGNMANLQQSRDKIEFIEGDIRSLDTVRAAVDGCELVFHQAAVVSVPQTVEDPLGSAQVNDIGTLNVLDAARRHGVRRVVLASSCAVFGDDPQMPKTETMTPKPMSPYAVQKLTTEFYARMYSQLYGLETASLRYFNVYGPRQDPSSPYSGVISIFMNKAIAGDRPVIYGDGEQSRDFIYVDDVVRANLMAAAAEKSPGVVLNIGTGAAVTINTLWQQIAALSQIQIQPRYAPAREGDIIESRAGTDFTRNAIGFSALSNLTDGLQATLDWYRRDAASAPS